MENVAEYQFDHRMKQNIYGMVTALQDLLLQLYV
jgi:hypothetical protein